MPLEAADGVNGGFAEDDRSSALGANPEVTGVLSSAGRQSVPDAVARAAQLGSNHAIGLPGYHHEDRIALSVGVHSLSVDERLQDVGRQRTPVGKISTYAIQLDGIGHR
jgi:hypothetical protein